MFMTVNNDPAENTGDTKEVSAAVPATNGNDAPSAGNGKAGMEESAKDYYRQTHSKSIEDKVRELQQNAKRDFAENEAKQSDAALNNSVSKLIDILKTDENGNLRPASELRKEREEGGTETEEEYGVPEHRRRTRKNEYAHSYEYVNSAQDAPLAAEYCKHMLLSGVFALITILITVITAVFEIGKASFIPALSKVLTGSVYARAGVPALISLGLLLICCFVNIDGLLRGMKKLSIKRPAVEAAAFAGTLVCLVHTLVTVIFSGSASVEPRTFCFAGCLVLSLLSVNTFIKALSANMAFGVIKSRRNKLATAVVEGGSEESGLFAKYLGEESEVMSVGRTERVRDFVKRMHTVPKAASSTNKMLLCVLLVSLVIGLLNGLLTKNVYEGITAAAVIFLMALPAGLLISTSLPYFVACIRVYKLRGAVLGEAACDLYENTGVVAFDDTEVFPPKSVKISSIKMFSDIPIDKIVRDMAKTFKKVGGSLSYVFLSVFHDDEIDSSDVMIVESAADGMHVKIAEDDLLIGRADYLRMYGIEVPGEGSETGLDAPLSGVLWFVCNSQLAAKFYLQYQLNPRFESVLNGLYAAGICASIRTCDPCIDDALLSTCLGGREYPVHVVKKPGKDIGKVDESRVTGIASVSSIHNFLKSFLIVDHLRSLYRGNVLVSMVGTILGLILASALVILSGVLSIAPLMISRIMLIYQLILLLPQIIISLTGKKY